MGIAVSEGLVGSKLIFHLEIQGIVLAGACPRYSQKINGTAASPYRLDGSGGYGTRRRSCRSPRCIAVFFHPAIGLLILVAKAHRPFLVHFLGEIDPVLPCIPGAIGHIAAHAVFIRVLADDVHHSAHRLAAVKRRRRAPQHLDPFHVFHGNGVPIHAAGIPVVHDHAVIEEKDIALAEPANGNAIGDLRHAVRTGVVHPREHRQRIAQGFDVVHLDILCRDDVDGGWHFQRILFRARRRHHDLVNGIGV